MLGTNDASLNTWAWYENVFDKTFVDFIELYSHVGGDHSPLVLVAVPPPLYLEGKYGFQQRVINSVLPRRIAGIANSSKCPIPIPVFQTFEQRCNLQGPLSSCDWMNEDGVHPNDAGYTAIARTVL